MCVYSFFYVKTVLRNKHDLGFFGGIYFFSNLQPIQQPAQQTQKHTIVINRYVIKDKTKPVTYRFLYEAPQFWYSSQSVNAVIPEVIGFGITIEIIDKTT